MATQLVIGIDSTGRNAVRFDMRSISRDGVTSDEKMLASKVLAALAKSPDFPTMGALKVGDQGKRVG